MAETTPSFTGLVIGYAVSHTFRIFRSKIYDALYVLFSCIVGVPLFIWLWGMPDAVREGAALILFAFAPLGVFTASVFIWHLWLAPAALAYEGASSVFVSMRPQIQSEMRPAPPDYHTWKQYELWSTDAFACLLDDIDPAGTGRTRRSISICGLIIDAMRQNQISYIKRYKSDYWSDDGASEVRPDGQSQIPRLAALSWAETHGYDVEKLK